ncbi:DUF2938 domain-containing protein [Vibrio sp. 99-8-1]|uniref:DUF2938 domain-containing protein n=1 Tax=Vibrio sp. 99-8-1 TaxID=2607602 RepID=UPI001493532B|nr:DUF2938 domain-containing protein [Vibrio sp. 99-8-1]NOI67166.1 DUF2938 domain-containing protein [Vibrio sp. 99-8-1]
MDISIWLQTILVGIGATIIMDAWALLQKRLLGIPSLNYALVARWVVLIPRGKLIHRPIMATPPVKGEVFLGWSLHYLIGIVFALILVLLMGEAWLADPSMIVALNTGIVTLIFPFFIIQPCLGFGIAASKTPSPWKARGLSLLAHSFYGLGLFVTAVILK